MRFPATLDTGAVDPIARVQLPWEAEYYVVINPTRYTIAVRIGSGSRPDAGNADMAVPPLGVVALPTLVREFMFVATTPALPLAPSGMPTVVQLLFTRGEAPPAFSSMALAGQPPASAVVLLSLSGNGGVFTSQDFGIPDGVNRIEVLAEGAQIPSYQITGKTTGIFYTAPVVAPRTYDGTRPTVPISRALDATLTLQFTPSTGLWTFRVLGWADPELAQLHDTDGRERVNPIAPGAVAVPVSMSLYPMLPAPSNEVTGAAIGPALGTTIATTTIAVTGDYCVEAEIMTSDTAGVGKWLSLAIGPSRAIYLPSPGMQSVKISRVSLAAAQTIVAAVSAASAGGAGSIYAANIRAYKIA